MLEGGHAMDLHFQTEAPRAKTCPIMLALTGLWHIDVPRAAHALRAGLRRAAAAAFPAYLQQLEMESNGKTTLLGRHRLAPRPTCPVVFGEPGTDAQHSFMQLVHQGTQAVPVDFLHRRRAGAFTPAEAHRILAANAFAQAEALLRGKTHDEVVAEMTAKGVPAAEIAHVAPHRVFSGNRPSNTILFQRLDASRSAADRAV